MDKKKYPHCAEALKYAAAVVSGDIPACKWVRAACQRQLDDLERWQDQPDAPFYFDFKAAEKIVKFIELTPHIKGRWAKARKLLKLEPWQKFIETTIYGWKQTADGKRRFREAYEEIARKNGKSCRLAAVGLYMLVEDDEAGAEVFCGATTERQAWKVFGPARLMANRAKGFVKHYGVEVNARNINQLSTASKFEPVIGDPGDGDNPHCFIKDEFHEDDLGRQYDTMITGMASREQPLCRIVTTAGFNLAGPCYAMRLRVQAVLSGTIEDESLFGIIYTIDDEDNWTSEEALKKANPNFGVSVDAGFLLREQRKATQIASQENVFKTKHLNLWCNADSAWLNMELWKACADTELKPAKFHDVELFKALDLSSKKDLAADLSLFVRTPPNESKPHFYFFGRFYLPQARLTDPDNPNRDIYSGWAKDGYLTITPGGMINQDEIKEAVIKDAKEFNMVECAFDPFQAHKLVGELMDEGLEMVEVGATVKNFSDPMKEFEALILDGRLHHDGNPVLTWCVSNVVCHTDKKDNIYPNKQVRESKIDGAVAAIMALGRAIIGIPKETTEPGVFDWSALGE